MLVDSLSPTVELLERVFEPGRVDRDPMLAASRKLTPSDEINWSV
jgi:hypothetical protein